MFKANLLEIIYKIYNKVSITVNDKVGVHGHSGRREKAKRESSNGNCIVANLWLDCMSWSWL